MRKTADHPRFDDALSLLDAGDVERLRDLLVEEPGLVRARITSEVSPYDGYFHRATLLHHVAGNPVREDLPDTIVEVARVVLEAGADPNAGCGGGPTQLDTGGGTTLGLVTSGAQAHVRSHTEALMDVLIEFGATLDPDGGMFGTLYHTVEHQGQREVARMLHARGVRADLPIAAGLGQLGLVRSFFDDGVPRPGSDDIWKRTARGGRPATPPQVLADAVLAAAVNGYVEVVAWLIEQGAEVDMLRSWGAFEVTALHGAGWAGWPDVITLLLERGADPDIRDPTHDGTPRDWAHHAGHAEAVAAFDRSRSG